MLTNALAAQILNVLHNAATGRATTADLLAMADKVAAAVATGAELAARRGAAGGSKGGGGRPGLPVWVDTGDWEGWVAGAPAAAKVLRAAGFTVTNGTLAVALSKSGRWVGQAQTGHHEPERHGFARKPTEREQAKLDAASGTKDAG